MLTLHVVMKFTKCVFRLTQRFISKYLKSPDFPKISQKSDFNMRSSKAINPSF